MIQSKPAAETVETNATEKQPPATDAATDGLLREAEAASRSAQSLSGDPPKKPSAKPAEKPSAAPPPTSVNGAPSRERFVIFTPPGPLICEVTLMIDGQWHTRALDKLVDDALATAKSDRGGSGLWSKLLVSPRFRYGQFGNVAVKNEEERQQAVMRYDRNRDDAVDRDEMRRFVTRNQAGGGSLMVHSEDPYRGQAALVSPVWQLLDVDGDQLLSAQELANASSRLRSRDRREDELLSLDELADTDQTAPMENMRRSRSYVAVAQALTKDTNWNRLLSTIDELYPRDQDEATSGSSWTAKFFKQLDADGDESPSTMELIAWSGREPDFRIEAHFGTDPSLSLPPLIGLENADQAPAKIFVEVLPGAAAPIAVGAVGDSLQLELPRLTIGIARSDSAIGPAVADSTAAAQFTQFDRDGNGYLDRDEFRATGQAAGAFDGVDGDDVGDGNKSEDVRDGKIYLDAWQVFLNRQQAASSSLIHVYVGHAPDPLFLALDTDRDGRLGAREMASAKTRLATLDTSADCQLAAIEVPQRMTIQLVRDNQSLDQMASPRAMPPAREVLRNGPAWFQRMDANGDGDISPREFLGTTARFRQLDGNGDGFIEASEASQASEAR